MKKLLPRFTPNFLLLKPGVVGGYRAVAVIHEHCADRPVVGHNHLSRGRLIQSANRR